MRREPNLNLLYMSTQRKQLIYDYKLYFIMNVINLIEMIHRIFFYYGQFEARFMRMCLRKSIELTVAGNNEQTLFSCINNKNEPVYVLAMPF